MNRSFLFYRICWIIITILAMLCLIWAWTLNAEAYDLEEMKKVDRYISKVNSRFDPDLIRAIAWHESEGWQIHSQDGNDIGLMRVNIRTIDPSKVDIYRLKTDYKYNIDEGVKILEDKYRQAIKIKASKKLRKKYQVEGWKTLEIALLSYNGLWPDKRNHCYVKTIKQIWNDLPWLNYLGLRGE